MEVPALKEEKYQVRNRSEITIAIVGGNTVAGHALSLLLKGAGYETTILKAPPTGSAAASFEDLDLLLVSPGLDDKRREKILATLRESERLLRMPVLAFSSAIEEGIFGAERSGATWPVEIGGLARAIEAALGGKVEGGTR
jgi:hypothetical protein